jgi:chromosome partitioning protein
VFVDCPPSLSLLTVNALTAADSVLIPLQTEYFALEGLSELMESIDRVRHSFNPRLEIEGILLTMFDERTNLARQVLADIRSHFGPLVYKTVIPRNVRLGEAPSFGKPVLAYDVKSRGAESYLALGREVLRKKEAR